VEIIRLPGSLLRGNLQIAFCCVCSELPAPPATYSAHLLPPDFAEIIWKLARLIGWGRSVKHY